MAISASIIGTMILANASSGITPSIVMSRPDDGLSNPSMWVAPCAITFDASATTKTGEINPFRNLHYSWDYGDSSKTNEYWIYGARAGTQSKNRDIGPIGGHVYETPGTYYVTLTVTDSNGKVNAIRQQIVVTDPDVVFSGANTYCFSTTGTFADTPDGIPVENLITTASLDTALSYAESDKRLMFKAGEVFTSTSLNRISDKQNIQICSFGVGAKPIFRIGANGASGVYLKQQWTVLKNIQIYDIEVDNPGNFSGSPACLGIYAEIDAANVSLLEKTSGYITFFRCKASNTANFGLKGFANAVVDCISIDPYAVEGVSGIWAASVNMSMCLGNYTNNNGRAEHSIRWQHHRSCIIAHNFIGNPHPNGKNALALRGASENTAAASWSANTNMTAVGVLRASVSPDNSKVMRLVSVTSSTLKSTGASEPSWPDVKGDTVQDGDCVWMYEFDNPGPYYYISKQTSVCDNFFTLKDVPINTVQTTQILQIGTRGATLYDVSSNIYVFNNFFERPSWGLAGNSRTYIYVQASDVTVRNNIIDMSEADNLGGISGIMLDGSNTAGIPLPINCVAENNSFFSTFAGLDNNKSARAIYFANAGSSGNVARNNVYHAPNAISTNSVTVIDIAGSATKSNNSTDAQVKSGVSPYIVNGPTTADGFKLATDSYALSAGASSDGVFVDYFGTTRSRLRNPDMGAIDSTI